MQKEGFCTWVTNCLRMTRQALYHKCIDQSPLRHYPHIQSSLRLFDAHLIRPTALNTTGSAGPSDLDVRDWRRLCTSFKEVFGELCHQLAMVAQRLCSTFVDPSLAAPFLASRLIALDKNPNSYSTNRHRGHCQTNHFQSRVICHKI